MADDASSLLDAARLEAYATPLDKIDVAVEERFAADTMWPFFERLRREDPVHYCAESPFGAYWSVTKFNDIVTVETNHQVFSSEKRIGIYDNEESEDFEMPMFIAMDPPKHDQQRKTISPIVAHESLVGFGPLIRERAAKILDELPLGEPFDWVDRVSVELTLQMLATLFGFPFEERRKLKYWSDLATTDLSADMTQDEFRAEMMTCAFYFKNLWDQRVNEPPANDLISMLAHGEATKDMPLMEFLGNILLLIVGGNDTTRNSITGGLIALNENPASGKAARQPGAARLRGAGDDPLADPGRPHAAHGDHADFVLGGKTIKAGDKVVMWYVSGNRDETAIEHAERVHRRPRAAAPARLPSASASIAASACGWPKCSCGSSGKRSSSASRGSRSSASRCA